MQVEEHSSGVLLTKTFPKIQSRESAGTVVVLLLFADVILLGSEFYGSQVFFELVKKKYTRVLIISLLPAEDVKEQDWLLFGELIKDRQDVLYLAVNSRIQVIV